MLSYFVYFEKKEVRIGYGTEHVASFIANRGAVLGEKRFTTRDEAEMEVVWWKTRLPFTCSQSRNRFETDDERQGYRPYVPPI